MLAGELVGVMDFGIAFHTEGSFVRAAKHRCIRALARVALNLHLSPNLQQIQDYRSSFPTTICISESPAKLQKPLLLNHGQRDRGGPYQGNGRVIRLQNPREFQRKYGATGIDKLFGGDGHFIIHVQRRIIEVRSRMEIEMGSHVRFLLSRQLPPCLPG